MLGPSNMEKLNKYDRGESDSDIALSDRAPGALNVMKEDKHDIKIEKLRKEVNDQFERRPKITMQMINYKETRPNKEPDLETKKRAKQKGLEINKQPSNTEKQR